MPAISDPRHSEHFELSRFDIDTLDHHSELCSTYENAEVASEISETTPALENLRSSSPTPSMNQTATSAKNSTQIGRHLQGWRMGVTLGAITTGVVLAINLSVIVWGAAGVGFEEGLRTLQQGSCKKTKDMSLWLHLAINALSTLLLGASNYTMQCLSSPTREEINAAHRKHKWLDIGIPSLRNLKHISRGKFLLWCLLALSSAPIHFLYNSVIFSTLSAQDYSVFAASAKLANGTALNWTLLDTMQHLNNAYRWQMLDNRDCIKAYGQDFISANGDLLIVLNTTNTTEMVRLITDVPGLGYGKPDWMCDVHDQTTYPSGCSVGSLLSEAANWTLFFRIEPDSDNGIDPGSVDWMERKVQYCISQPVEEQCRVQISLVILGTVVACNTIKALCMLLTIQSQKSQPLVTLGDAIESFMQDPDRMTDGMCLASKDSFGNIGKEKLPISPTDRLWHSWLKSLHGPAWTAEPTEWRTCRHWWFSGASLTRWLTCNILCFATLGAAGALLYIGVGNLGRHTAHIFSRLWQLGFGNVTSQLTINWSFSGNGGLLTTILVANSPQILLSFLYLMFNGLFTCMLLVNEWAGYAHNRKPLRVTSPANSQRSTYRLQLPYKYGVPSILFSGTLHWLVSQSIFLTRISSFTYDGVEDPANSISTVGFSLSAIVTVIALGTVVVLLGILNGFRRYPPGIPLAGSCSAAISAACHRPEGDTDAAEKPLMWGAVETEGSIGHCCFTSFEVEKPVAGKLYAGWKSE